MLQFMHHYWNDKPLLIQPRKIELSLHRKIVGVMFDQYKPKLNFPEKFSEF